MTLCGVLGLPDGSRLIRLGIEGPVTGAAQLGQKLAAMVRKAGGDEILQILDDQAETG